MIPYEWEKVNKVNQVTQTVFYGQFSQLFTMPRKKPSGLTAGPEMCPTAHPRKHPSEGPAWETWGGLRPKKTHCGYLLDTFNLMKCSIFSMPLFRCIRCVSKVKLSFDKHKTWKKHVSIKQVSKRIKHLSIPKSSLGSGQVRSSKPHHTRYPPATGKYPLQMVHFWVFDIF